jgi:Tfp pilus assembly protein FimT
LELLLTLAILATAASLAAPAFLRMLDNRRLEGASRQVAAALRQSREQAIREQRVLLVKFEPEGTKVQLIEAGGRMRGEIELSRGVRVRAIHPGGSLTESPTMPLARFGTRPEEPQALIFTPSGTTEDAQVVLENERGRQVRVRVDGFTGMARVERVEQAARR